MRGLLRISQEHFGQSGGRIFASRSKIVDCFHLVGCLPRREKRGGPGKSLKEIWIVHKQFQHASSGKRVSGKRGGKKFYRAGFVDSAKVTCPALGKGLLKGVRGTQCADMS